MADSYLDRYGRSQSICHRLLPRAKVLLTFAVVLAGVSVPAEFWPVQGVLAVLVFVGHSFARIPLSYLVKRLAVFLPMVFLASAAFPLSQGFASGWEMMVTILFRSTLSFLAVLWLVNVMPFDQLLVTLRGFHVPAVFVATLSFTYRYLFLLWDELDKMRTARHARTFHKAGLWFRWKTSMHLIGMLLIRAMGRAERIHGAMCARGWDGTVRVLNPADARPGRRD